MREGLLNNIAVVNQNTLLLHKELSEAMKADKEELKAIIASAIITAQVIEDHLQWVLSRLKEKV